MGLEQEVTPGADGKEDGWMLQYLSVGQVRRGRVAEAAEGGRRRPGEAY